MSKRSRRSVDRDVWDVLESLYRVRAACGCRVGMREEVEVVVVVVAQGGGEEEVRFRSGWREGRELLV